MFASFANLRNLWLCCQPRFVLAIEGKSRRDAFFLRISVFYLVEVVFRARPAKQAKKPGFNSSLASNSNYSRTPIYERKMCD